MANIVTIGDFIQERVEKLGNFGEVTLPDPKEGGLIYQRFPETNSPTPHYVYFSCPSLDTYLESVRTIESLKDTKEELSFPDAKKLIGQTYPAWPERSLTTRDFESRRKYFPLKQLRNNEALASYLLSETYDFDSNYGIQLFGNSSEFFLHLFDLMKNSKYGKEMTELYEGRLFNIGKERNRRRPIQVTQSTEAENQVEVWPRLSSLELSHFVNDFATFIEDNGIPAHFGHSKNWSGPAENHLVGAFYDPNWKK